MKNFVSLVCSVAAVAILAVNQASAQLTNILAWDVAGHGTPVDATLTATTIQTDLANSPALSRVDVIGIAAGNSFNANNWNTGAFAQNNFYFTFTMNIGSSNITLESLQWSACASGTGPTAGRWGYSVNGGAFTTTDFTYTLPPTAFAPWNIGGVGVNSGGSVEFRMWGFSAGAAGGSGRIANTAGNDLILTYAIVPEPSTLTLIGVGLLGLVAFARRRSV